MILVTGYIKNSSGQPIPFASVQILDGFFEYTGEGTAASANGFFQLYVNEDHEPYMLTASSVGYKSAGIKLSTWANGTVITLQQEIKTNEGVIVYSDPRPAKKPFPAWLAFIPLLAVIADQKNGGRKVSGIKSFYEGLPPWARGVVIVGGGFVAYSTLNKILKKKPADKEEPKAADQQLIILQQQGITPTYSSAQFESFSNAIVQAIWDCGTDEAAIFNVMAAMNNQADILKLVSVYGVRAYKGCFENFFSLVERSLSGAISSELDASDKAKINSTFRSKGITFQFA